MLNFFTALLQLVFAITLLCITAFVAIVLLNSDMGPAYLCGIFTVVFLWLACGFADGFVRTVRERK